MKKQSQEIDNQEWSDREEIESLRARVAELEGAHNQICAVYCLWYDNESGYAAAVIAYRLCCIARKALTGKGE